MKTGFSVTDEDNTNGIYTLTHKLDRLCSGYERMDMLFGHCPNITPLCEHGDEDELTVGQPAAQDKPLMEQVDSQIADDLDEGEVDFTIDDLTTEEDEFAVNRDKDNDVYEDLEPDQV
ncbi:hypothetical protein BGZ74_004323, partial [Mortierella antarctica]